MTQHEVLSDLNGSEVLRRQGGHHVNVPDASVRVLDVEVERLFVEDRSGGVLVFVRPAPDLIMPFMNVTTSSGCCSAMMSVHVMTAGTLHTCRVQSGYLDRSSIALNLPVASWRCWNGP
ncbi:MAG: hypothetical protein ACXV5H_00975, partial [Halobacteriota archaeon]